MSYPGFTLEDCFSKPAIKIPSCQSKIVIGNDKVVFEYNQFGYRTIEFDSVPDKYFLVVGCSLTEGHGLDYNNTWSQYVSQQIKLTVVNLAKGSANAQFCYQAIKQWIPFKTNPQFVIIQWPNPYRIITWGANGAKFVSNNNPNKIYAEFLKASDDNFWSQWVQAIVNTNNYCNLHQIPILNICFESVDAIPSYILQLLTNNNINLHVDQKIQGNTWHFDNQAKDNQHHSPWCNNQWADRIISLLD
jgi:hypothetical protein